MTLAAQRLPVRPQKRRGAFITLEGGEGAGKSTQTHHILQRLQEARITAIATREPGGSPRAEILRRILLSGKAKSLGPAAEAILFAAARIDHLDTKIEPALAAGTSVVCDRFADSTRAYQGATGKLDPRFLRTLDSVTHEKLRPDLTLILDLPVEEGRARAARRGRSVFGCDRFESEDLGFHRIVRDGYLAIAAEDPGRCAVIDARKPEAEVARAIWETILRRVFHEPGSEAAHGL
jgi:dTMP kinase